MDEDDHLLKYSEAARLLHCSESTARRLGASGQLEQLRISPGIVRVRASSVTRYLQHGYSAPQLQEAS